MKNNAAGKLLSITLLAIMLAGFILPANFYMTAKAGSYSVEAVIDDILRWKNNGSVQSLVDDISADMGNSAADWYAISLSRYKYKPDFSNCKSSLDAFTSSTSNLRAVDKQRIAIVYTAMGYTSPNIDTALNSTIGKLGVMSYIYGLIMLDCGSYYGSMTRDEIINEILSLQLSDGGWGLAQSSDVDVTAAAIQSLARYYKYNDVKSAVDKAIEYLSQRQQTSGAFKSYGAETAESTAQVLLALNTMKINYKTDGRFIKNGNTVYDGLMRFRKSDGSFSHTLDGAENDLATVQSLYSLISLWRYEKGKSSFFEFVDNNIEREVSGTVSRPSTNKPPQSSAEKPSSDNASRISDGTSGQSSYNQTSGDTEAPDKQNITSSNSNGTSAGSSASSKSPQASSKAIDDSSLSDISSTAPSKSITSDESGGALRSAASLSSKGDDKSEVAAENSMNNNNSNTDYNLIIVLCIVGIFIAALTALIIKRKLNRKNFILLVVMFAVLVFAALTVRIETAEQYYGETSSGSKAESAAVVMSISCKEAVGNVKNDKIPSDGVILSDTEISINEGDTVFDVLLSAAKKNHIQLDYDGSDDNEFGTVYIKGINYLYEFDCGELSGWIYRVNGETPSVGCSGYELEDGDVVEWVYTTTLGKGMAE